MSQRLLQNCIVSSLVLLFSAISSAATFNYSLTCAQATVGPITISADSVPLTGSVTLTPGVLATGLNIISEGQVQITNSYPTSGNFSGTRSCALTFGGVTVNFTRSYSLAVATSVAGENCTPTGFAGSCLTWAPVSVTVNLGAQGTVVISAPALTTDGFDTSEVTIGFITIVPGSALDTALFTAAPPGTPVPPSVVLLLIGLAGVSLYQSRRWYARPN
jgi:hypothetical protein